MNYEDAKEIYQKRYIKGRKSSLKHEFPFGNRYFDDEFLEVIIEIKYLNHDRYRVHENVISEYRKILSNNDMDPIWIQAGKKLKSGSVKAFHDDKILVVDGNHRMHAHLDLKLEVIKAIVPKSHIKLLGDIHG